MKTEVTLPFDESPPWLASLVLSREGDDLVIEAIRRSGTQLGVVRINTFKLQQVMDLLNEGNQS